MDQRQSVNKAGWLLIIFIMINWSAHAQPDCRSTLGAHNKPIGHTDVSWAFEGAVAGAVMNDRYIANTSLYSALGYQFGKSNFYFEGAYKNWYNSASNPDGVDRDSSMIDYNKPTRYHWGLRELHYKFQLDDFTIKAGVQGLKSKDYFLFDERMLGVLAEKYFGAFNISGSVGSVSQRIARFQDVCGNRHVYNIIHRSQFNFVSDNLWESNYGAMFLTWNPRSGMAAENEEDVELSDDEFGSFDEFSTDDFSNDEFVDDEFSRKRNGAKVEEAGLFFYEEFGSGFHEYKYYSGAYASFTFWTQLNLKVEFVDQYIYNDHALAYFAEAEKVQSWSNGASTQLQLGYLGVINISEEAHFYPAFTNLFLGEVMRMDAIDLPLVYGSVKHVLPGKWKWNVQLNGAAQLQSYQSKELDLVLDFKPIKNIRISGIGSVMSSELLESTYWMAKLEVRIAI